MIDRKEIELLIRAQLRGERDITSVTKSINELQAAIKRQADEAEKGSGSIDDLKASMLALKNAQDSLTSQADTIGRFQKLAEAIKKTEDRVTRAGKAYETYEKKLQGLSTVTEAQQDRLLKLSQSFERAQATVQRQRSTFDQLGDSLRKAGVDTNKLADAEIRLRESAGQVGLLYGQASSAIQNYATNAAKAREATAALADQQRKLQQLQAGNEADARLGAQQQLDRIKRIEQAEANRLANLQKFGQTQFSAQAKAAAESELAAIRESEAFLKRYNEEKVKGAALDAGLRKTAADAQAAAKGYGTLARASTDLRPKVVSLRDAINGINDPAKAARTNLAGVEQEIADIAKSVGQAKGPLEGVADSFRKLQAAQRALSDQAGLVDGFQRQVALLREQRAEFVAARAQVAQYAAAVRQGGAAGEAFVKPLAEAQVRLRAAAAAMRDQTAATRASRDALREAGVNTSNLADAQRRLTESAKTAATASRQLAEASERQGVATGKAAAGFRLFRDEGRTTLSLLQRIRGEVLALAAAYVGLQGTLRLAGGAIDAFSKREGLRNQLGISVGNDRKAIDEEYAYVKAQSDRIGIEFETAIAGFAKFSAAASLAGRGREEIKFIFETFSEVGRVGNLTTDNLNGVFKALEQIFSKGKIQAEELRLQLGDRLFGAFQVAAKALEDQFPDFNKALEQGLVSADNLIFVAEKYRDIVKDQLADATQTLSANQARLNNEIFDFKLALADAGFADEYVKVIRELTTFLQSPDGANFAQALSSAFSSVLGILRLVLGNLEEVKLVGGIVAGLFAVSLFGSVAGRAVAAAKAIGGVAVALTAVQKAMLVFGSFVVGWNIGAYFRDKFVEVRLAGIALVVGFASIWSRIKFGAMEIWEDLPRLAGNAFKSVLNEATTFMRLLLTVFKAGARALGLTGLADGLDKALDSITFKTNQVISSRVAQIRAEAEADLKRIREIGDQMADDAISGPASARRAAAGKPTPSPGGNKQNTANEISEADIRKRENLIESITRALEALDAKIDRTQTDTLSKQLDAIDTEYLALARRIKALGGKEAVNFLQQLDAAVSQLKLQTTRKFNDRILAEQEALLRKIEAAEAAAGRKDKQSLDARLQAIADSYAATYREIEEARNLLVANNLDTSVVDESRRRLDAAVAELSVLERQKFMRDEIQRREQQINDLVQTRSARLQTIDDQLQAGLITREQADQKQRETIEQLQPQIEALAALGEQFALSIAGAFDPIKLQEFLDKLELVKGSGARLNEELNRTGAIIRTGIGQGIDNTLNNAFDSLVNLAKGTEKWGDVFEAVGKTILQSLADILKQIALAIIRQQILLALRAAFPGLPVPVAHSGMVVGQGSNRSRNVDAGWFAGAPRYHSGGIVGLRPDEYPAILQKNEEVLSKSDPRNVMNGGGRSGGSSQPSSQRFVLVDDRSRVAEAMAGAEGEEVTIMHLRKNLPTVRSLLKGG